MGSVGGANRVAESLSHVSVPKTDQEVFSRCPAIGFKCFPDNNNIQGDCEQKPDSQLFSPTGTRQTNSSRTQNGSLCFKLLLRLIHSVRRIESKRKLFALFTANHRHGNLTGADDFLRGFDSNCRKTASNHLTPPL